MALDKISLKNGILTLMQDMRTRDVNADDEFANRLSDLIDAFVKTGRVNTGIAVSTTGTSSAQTGFTTSQGTIS